MAISTIQDEMLDSNKGVAKAWVNFNGTGTVAIRDSFNVSSITDNGVGRYTINFTTAFADTNYCVTHSSGDDSTSDIIGGIGDYATSSCKISTRTGINSDIDTTYNCASIFAN